VHKPLLNTLSVNWGDGKIKDGAMNIREIDGNISPDKLRHRLHHNIRKLKINSNLTES
jgi:hypothetical protein